MPIEKNTPDTLGPVDPPAYVESYKTAVPAVVPQVSRTYLDYGIDALAIVAASVLLYLKVITDTQWTATVVAVSAGRAALRLPGTPPSGGAVSAIALGLMSFFKHNRT